jgi:F-type H+-transporting ATPase subunit b
MLDFYKEWFIVLVLNFFGLIYILNLLLFKPLLKIFKEREETVKGSIDASREMNSRKEEGIKKLQKEITDARIKAKEVFETLRNEGLNKQKESLHQAEATAASMLQKAREELRAEVEKARKSLRADVEKFSDEIVRKLVKA